MIDIMNDFLKIFIHPLDILKVGWLNLKIPSLKLHKCISIRKLLNCIRLDGTNEIERELPFLIELTDPRAIEDFFGCDQVRKKKKKLTSFTLLL
jgi:hypothetical protein